MKIEDRLYTYENSREKCSICGRNIPEDVDRISFDYRTHWGSSYIRVCGMCILTLSESINKKPIERWNDKLMVDKL